LTRNQYVFTHSFTLTQNRVFASIEKATGAKFGVQKAAIKSLTEVKRKSLGQRSATGSRLKNWEIGGLHARNCGYYHRRHIREWRIQPIQGEGENVE